MSCRTIRYHHRFSFRRRQAGSTPSAGAAGGTRPLHKHLNRTTCGLAQMFSISACSSTEEASLACAQTPMCTAMASATVPTCRQALTLVLQADAIVRNAEASRN